MKSIKKNTICVIPWNHMAILQNGDLGICCQCVFHASGRLITNGKAENVLTTDFESVRNHPTYVELRRSMLNGEQHELCKLCWDEEEVGVKSKRQYQQIFYPETTNKILNSTDLSGRIDIEEFPIKYLDLRLGNLCNLKCRSCGPGDSSLWVEDWYKLENNSFNFHGTRTTYEIEKVNNTFKIKGDDFQYFESEKFNDVFKSVLPNIDKIYFTGGEPLINKNHYDLLDSCIKNNVAKDIMLEYNTNGTTLNKRLLDQWKHFKRVQIAWSIDAVGDLASYIRYPTKWDVVEKNMEELDNSDLNNVFCTVTTTISILNVMHFPEMVDWFEKKQFKKFFRPMGYHLLHGPEGLNIKILPQETKNKIAEMYKDFSKNSTIPGIVNHFDAIINFMNSEDKSNLIRHAKYRLDKVDIIRDQKLRDYLPWLADVLEQ
jgi:MoaA/NifB/PqqE/SkfB family radical SAM enzyme